MSSLEPFAHLLPSRPVLSSDSGGSTDTILERYHHPPGVIDVPGLTNTLVVMHMRGPVAVEEKLEHSGWVRRWTDRGQASVTPAGAPVARRFTARPEVLLIQIVPRLAYRGLTTAANCGTRASKGY